MASDHGGGPEGQDGRQNGVAETRRDECQVELAAIKQAPASAMAEDTSGSRNEGDTAAQITRLREQIEALMRDRVTSAVAEAAGRVETVIHAATDTLRSEAESLASKVP